MIPTTDTNRPTPGGKGKLHDGALVYDGAVGRYAIVAAPEGPVDLDRDRFLFLLYEDGSIGRLLTLSARMNYLWPEGKVLQLCGNAILDDMAGDVWISGPEVESEEEENDEDFR